MGVGVGVGVPTAVGVGVTVGVEVALGVGVRVAVAVGVLVGVRVPVAVGVTVGVGVTLSAKTLRKRTATGGWNHSTTICCGLCSTISPSLLCLSIPVNTIPAGGRITRR
jgi:hypothetical protein